MNNIQLSEEIVQLRRNLRCKIDYYSLIIHELHTEFNEKLKVLIESRGHLLCPACLGSGRYKNVRTDSDGTRYTEYPLCMHCEHACGFMPKSEGKCYESA